MRRISERVGINLDYWLAGLGLLAITLLLILQPFENHQAYDLIQNTALILAGVLLPTLWMARKDSKWRERLAMIVVLLVPTGVAIYWKHFTVTTILVVGNSHGGLQDEIDRFNIAFADENLRAELVVDWQSYSDTNERFAVAHEFLEGKRRADVIELDTVWLPGAIEVEGLAPLGKFFINSGDLLPQALEIGRDPETKSLFAVPLYVDVGLVIYRKDLLGELPDPVTPSDLEAAISDTNVSTTKGLEGFIFQGAQYEGLNCVFFEVLSSMGGRIEDVNRDILENMVLSTLKSMHGMIYDSGIVPSSVLTMKEQDSYQLFTRGHVLIIRDWSYLVQSWDDDSFKVDRESVGITNFARPVLGGWHLGMLQGNQSSDAAWQLIEFLTRPSTLKTRAMHTNVEWRRIPADLDVLSQLTPYFPFVPSIREALLQAEPRPRLPHYMTRFSDPMSSIVYEVLASRQVDENRIRTQLDRLR